MYRPGDFVIENGRLTGCRGTGSRFPEEVFIPGSVASIGEGAFAAASIGSVILPNSVRVIEDRAFAGCRDLQMVWIPDSVRWIGDRAFEDCTCLRAVRMPENPERIGKRIFPPADRITPLDDWENPENYVRPLVWRRGKDSYTACWDPLWAEEVPAPIYLGGSPLTIRASLGYQLVMGFGYAMDHGVEGLEAWREEYHDMIRPLVRRECWYAVFSRYILSLAIREKLLDRAQADLLLRVFQERKELDKAASILQYQREAFGEEGPGAFDL